MKLAHVLLVLVLAGCATASEVQGPGGGRAFIIKCGAAAMHLCYEKAAEVCPGGYAMIDRASGAVVASPTVVTSGPNTMLVECKR